MQSVVSLLAIVAGYYAYQWGSGHKKKPHIIVVTLVMLSSLIVTIPAYYIGRHYKEAK